jgi:hypothetical protein
MNWIGLAASVLHITLLIIMYLVVPKFAPPSQKETIEHWVLASFSAVFLVLTMVSVKDVLNIFIILAVGSVVLSGLVWWVPTYIPEEDQELASHILIIASSLVITTISIVYSLHETEVLGLQQTSAYEALLGGKRRRR